MNAVSENEGAMEQHLATYLIHYKAPEWCESAVSSLAGSEGVDLSILVIDNSGEMVGLPDASRVIQTGSNLGYAGGANAAIRDWWHRFPQDEYVVIGSHDLHVELDTLRVLLNSAVDNPQFGVLGPCLTLGGKGEAVADDHSSSRIDQRTWISGTCMLLTRTCLAEIGGFDEAFGSYVEDVEFCMRAWDAGYRVGRVPAAIATGLGSSSPRSMEMIRENNVVLEYRRGGSFGALNGLARYLKIGIKGFVFGLIHPDARKQAWTRSRHHLLALVRAPERLATIRRLGRTAVPTFGSEDRTIGRSGPYPGDPDGPLA